MGRKWGVGISRGMDNFLLCARCEAEVLGEGPEHDQYQEDNSYICDKCKTVMKFTLVERVDSMIAVGRLEELH